MNIGFPFAVGADYENWEYHLEIKKDKIKNYDSYNYLKHTEFLGLFSDNVELIFNYDTLQIVILSFKYVTEEILQNIKICCSLGESKPLVNKNLEIGFYVLDGELELWYIYNPSEYTLEIRYGNKKLLREISL
jgi:hypothetical protein